MSDTWLLIVVAVPLYLLAIWALIEVATRRDLSGGRRVLWVLALLLVPAVALAVYLAVRPPRRIVRLVEANPAGSDTAEAIVTAAEARQRGALDDDGYRSVVADVVG